MRPFLILGFTVLAAGCAGSSSATAPTAADSSGAVQTTVSPSSTPSPTATTASGPPTVHEVFTTLPCDPNTTVGMEGCAEHRILRADTQVNRALARLWAKAADNDARDHLVAAESAWQDYREAQCLAESDVYAGGTLAPVADARCTVRLTRVRAVELRRQVGLAAGG